MGAITKGRRKYGFFPNIRERLQMAHLQLTKGLIHFLSRHDSYNNHLSKKSSKILRACGNIGTPEHAIFSRERYDVDLTIRDEMP